MCLCRRCIGVSVDTSDTSYTVHPKNLFTIFFWTQRMKKHEKLSPQIFFSVRLSFFFCCTYVKTLDWTPRPCFVYSLTRCASWSWWLLTFTYLSNLFMHFKVCVSTQSYDQKFNESLSVLSCWWCLLSWWMLLWLRWKNSLIFV